MHDLYYTPTVQNKVGVLRELGGAVLALKGSSLVEQL